MSLTLSGQSEAWTTMKFASAGWKRGRKSLPSLRLANLIALRHPLSVDTYVERTLSGAKGILVRLIGGESYWQYGVTALHQLAKARGQHMGRPPKLTPQQQREARRRRAEGATLKELAKSYNVGRATISRLAT